jgi:hypothetical protein
MLAEPRQSLLMPAVRKYFEGEYAHSFLLLECCAKLVRALPPPALAALQHLCGCWAMCRQSKSSGAAGVAAAAADEFDQAKLARKADQLALLFQFVPQARFGSLCSFCS